MYITAHGVAEAAPEPPLERVAIASPQRNQAIWLHQEINDVHG